MRGKTKPYFVAIGLVVWFAASHAASAQSGPAAFCSGHPDADFPAKTYYGSAYSDSKTPKAVREAGANSWRCMDGRVLVCSIGADGRPCQKLEPSTSPSEPIISYCVANPSADFVPMVVIGHSSATWRCRSGVPQVLKSETLDERSFIRSAWRPLPR
jgi:hypothetical protein